MAEQFDEFLEEVQNDIRQERWAKLWEKYGKILTTFVTGIILVVAGYTIWQNYQKTQQEKTADRFLHALDLTNAGQKQQALLDFSALSHTAKGNYRLFSQFHQAALLAGDQTEKGQNEALKIYESIQTNRNYEAHWRDLALLFSLMMRTDQISAQKTSLSSASDLQTALIPLKEESNPWHYAARELDGILFFQQEKYSEARAVFLSLAKDNKAPKGIILRAQLMSQVLAEQK